MTDYDNQRILVVAPLGRDGPVTAAILQEHGLSVEVCTDTADAARKIGAGAGMLLATEEAFEQAGMSDLLAQLQAQPAWSELPLIILTRGSESRLCQLLALTAKVAGVVTLLERPLGVNTLLRTVEVALGSRRRQYQVRDLLEQQRQQTRALRESEERLQLAWKATRDVVWDWDVQSDQTRWSQALTDLFGWTDAIESPQSVAWWEQRVHPQDRTRVLQCLRAALNDPACQQWQDEYQFLRHDGSVANVLDRGHIIRDAAGRPQRMIGAIQDITERKRSEEAVRRLNATLELRVLERTAKVQKQADQLRKLASELIRAEERERRNLAQLLHDDLQQTLVGIKMRLSIAQGPQNDEPRRAWARQMEDLLDEAIRTSRTLTAELSPPILYDAGLVAALRWLAQRMQDKHGLKVEFSGRIPEDGLDEEMRVFLFQAVREMLFNVVKHAGVNRARVRLTQDDGRVIVQVEDAGKGFDAAAPHGDSMSGFGIFSLRQRVHLMAGRMDLDSAPGQGTRVRLEVNLPRPKAPAAPEGSAPAAPPPTPAPSPAPRDDSTIRVLLADDHKLLREGLASLLKGEHGIEVVGHASNGREAVDLASKLHPDVVVMDISMPQLDGIEATRAITANGYAGRVIGLSMHEAYEMKARMIAAGAVTALRKDGPSHEFIAAIRHSSPQRT